MLLALILLILWPIAELFVIVKVAEAIGILLTLVLLIGSWPLGTWVIRSEARSLGRRALRGIAAGRPAGLEALDALFVMLAGVLLLVPGFITDAFALILLLKPARILARRKLARHQQSQFVRFAARFADRTPPYDVDGTAHDATVHEVEPPRVRP